MGVLTAERLRGKEIFSFEYDKKWLKSSYAQILDPDLQLYQGPQYLYDGNKQSFGMFLDSSPDRWGRVLMRRREAALARKEARSEQSLFETDYLLGVYDPNRMGGLRFKQEPSGAFLNDDKDFATPPWASIRKLEEISLKLEEDDSVNAPEYIQWLQMLVTPGSSLGGERPKASIMDPKGQLWIAKFPSKYDQNDNTGAWEMVTHELAQKAGLHVPEAMAQQFSSTHHTFLTKRFDRLINQKRLHFASAMTLLGHTDGANYQAGVSYLELVEFIEHHGGDVNADLQELWRRIVFSICVSNTDDHLRNHGFILTPKGWKLSPAYDLNPIETGTGLKLNISENDNALSLGLAMEVAEYFRLSPSQAEKTMQQVTEAVSDWEAHAKHYRIPAIERSLKSNAFRLKK